jgi:16S rRNA (cytosine967-C5)-methyltransferase
MTQPTVADRSRAIATASPRGLALQGLLEVEEAGGRANVVVPDLLAASRLAERDRAFVTELVYGTLRMRRACDWLVDRRLRRPVEPGVRAALRLGAYQLAFLRTPAHAAVSATVAEVVGPARGLVNAVLRRVAADVAEGPAWPSEPVQLSYPDWIVEELTASLGAEDAAGALAQMNVPPTVTVRADGYVQDRASQWVGQAVLAIPGLATGRRARRDPATVPWAQAGAAFDPKARTEPHPGGAAGERIADLCAAPGGKATTLGHGTEGGAPSIVVAGDIDFRRAAVMAENVTRVGAGNVATLVFDGRRPPFPASVFDRVLVDAPCSGLGVLRRRPDARWRIQADDVPRLAGLQRGLLDQALILARTGGLVVYSVCTLTRAETTEIDEWLATSHPEAVAVTPPVADPWKRVGRGARLLPQAAGTDGMFLLVVRRS